MRGHVSTAVSRESCRYFHCHSVSRQATSESNLGNPRYVIRLAQWQLACWAIAVGLSGTRLYPGDSRNLGISPVVEGRTLL
jgi:hypothetical protein